MSDIIGIALREGQLDVIAVRRGVGGHRVLTGLSVPANDEAPAAVQRALREAGVRGRRTHVGLPRRTVVAKAVELPVVPGADLRRMVGFELPRHLPFPAADAVFDFEILEAGDAGRPARVLLVAIERRAHDRVQQLLRDAGLTPRHVGVSIHSLARAAAGRTPAGRPGGGRLVLWLDEAEAELAVVARGRVVASRAFPLPPDPDSRARALREELDRTAAALVDSDRADLAEVLVGGHPAPFAEWNDLPVREGLATRSGLDGAGLDQLPALALALDRPARGERTANLLPEGLRPRPFPWPLATTAALALLTLGIGAAIPTVTALRERRTLAAIEAEIAQLAPAVQRAERFAAGVERARRELTTLRDFEAQGLRPPSLLHEITEILPGDVWLTSLSADRNGIELAGFANTASQLIALLEASPRIERVEFTSPVTKGRDREQFRLKAAWEGRGRAR